MAEQKQRIEWIDIAKGIGIIAVLIGHTNSGILRDEIYSFHIPLFIFLSGMLFNGGTKTAKDFFVSKIKRIAVPYYFWALIFFGISVIVPLLLTHTFEFDPSCIKYIYMGRKTALWFLGLTFCLNAVFFVLSKAFKSKLLPIGIVCAALSVGAMIYYYRLGGGDLWFNFDAACASIPFFFAGYWFKNNSLSREKLTELKPLLKIALTVILLAVNIALNAINCRIYKTHADMFYNSYLNPVLFFLSAFAGIAAIILISTMINSKALRYIGKNSMTYFILHQSIVFKAIDVFYQLSGFNPGNTADCIIKTVSSLLLLTVLNEIIIRTPLRFSLGCQKAK